jgi:hypothetical protein
MEIGKDGWPKYSAAPLTNRKASCPNRPAPAARRLLGLVTALYSHPGLLPQVAALPASEPRQQNIPRLADGVLGGPKCGSTHDILSATNT